MPQSDSPHQRHQESKMKMQMTLRVAFATAIAAIAGNVLAVPIDGTGFSADAIAEKEGATPDEVSDYNGLARWVFAEAGSPSIDTTTATVAVPDSADRTFTSNTGTEFALQPYDQNNLPLSGDTFTLDVPGPYADLQFLIFGIGGNTADNFQATLNFSDASSTLLTFSIADWQASRPYDASGRTAIARRGEGGWASYFGPGIYPRELSFDLSPADQAKVIQSIDFTLRDRLAVSAISGTSAGPAPSFAITRIEYDPDAESVILTWDSNEGEVFAVKYSTDMSNWDADVDDGVVADAGDSTTLTFGIADLASGDGKLFFRVERR